MLVQVYNNDVNGAMRKLKKKLFEEGVINEIMRRRYYEKPSDRKRRERKENIARSKKEHQKYLSEL